MSSDVDTREFRAGRAKLRHGLVVACLLAILGLWLILFAGDTVAHAELAGIVNLILAAGILFAAHRAANDPRPHMVLDKDGIWYRGWGLDRVPWHQICDAYSSGIRLNSFACIELHDPEALLAGLPAEQRRKLEANRLVRPPRLLVPNGALDAPLHEVLGAIRAGLQQAGRRRDRAG